MFHKRFKWKILSVTVVGIGCGIVITTGLFFIGLNTLQKEIENLSTIELRLLTKQNIQAHMQYAVGEVNHVIHHLEQDLTIFGDYTQYIFDHRKELADLIKIGKDLPSFKNIMIYNAEGKYLQNIKRDNSVVTSRFGLLKDDKQLKDYPQKILDTVFFLDLLMPPMKKHGFEKKWVYFIGNKKADFIKLYPWTDFGASAIGFYPEQMEVSYWERYFPNLIESWNTVKMLENKTWSTFFIPPSLDSASGEIIQIIGYPLYDKEEQQFIGAVWFDLALTSITTTIEKFSIGDNGFAFLATPHDGSVIAVSDFGLKKMGLQNSAYLNEQKTYIRKLQDSSNADIKNLSLVVGNKFTFKEIVLDGEKYLLVLQGSNPFNVFVDGSDHIQQGQFILGFFVPEKAMFSPIFSIKDKFSFVKKRILMSQGVIFGFMMLSLIFVVFYFTKRIISGLEILAKHAQLISHGEYTKEIPITSNDEIGELSEIFNTMNRKLQKQFSDVENRNKELEQVIFFTSHDLRTPLVSIQGFANELEEGYRYLLNTLQRCNLKDQCNAFTSIQTYLTSEISESIDFITKAVQQMDGLLHGLLQLSRVKRVQLNYEIIYLQELIEDILTSPEFINGTKIDVKNVVFYGDKLHMTRVFANLIENSIKYSRDGVQTIITIEGILDDGYSIICVEDNGMGIPSNELDNVFEMFYRVPTITIKNGDGLGLTIVKEIIQKHHGEIWVESDLGSGSRFYIKLPFPENLNGM